MLLLLEIFVMNSGQQKNIKLQKRDEWLSKSMKN
ncbi:hypothetical protein Mgra_00006299 [Meloidogyne graminicola]|uniref:Uncharacterized protein n=1 Tax=Meloidogyne graminicola TaxID=189291 RepID=A0A8S9ZM41_9BILA|nr:hypothetical protein Mgra_00006299 [Meloidogyne graminicola]